MNFDSLGKGKFCGISGGGHKQTKKQSYVKNSNVKTNN